ncbi:hypothetical protein U9M48_026331 [Paspalum notatum var. saurae]|uniref:Uncharacterized protein n=1 Tax=Paspalum notatum var. saurae TaxID=547442 RepID=A0AAQ3WYW1_PASNO
MVGTAPEVSQFDVKQLSSMSLMLSIQEHW